MAVMRECTGVLCSVDYDYGFFKSVKNENGEPYPDVFVRVSELKRKLERMPRMMRTYNGALLTFDVDWSVLHPGKLEARNVRAKELPWGGVFPL